MIVISIVVLWCLVTVLTVLVVLLYRQFGLVYLGSSGRIRLQGLAAGKNAPELLLKSALGETRITWEQPRERRGTLALFGTSTCPVCAHLVRELHATNPDDLAAWEVLVIEGVPAGSPEEDAPRLALPELRPNWMVATSPDDAAHEAFDVSVSPFAFVIDGTGRILTRDLVNTVSDVMKLIRKSESLVGSIPVEIALGPALKERPRPAGDNESEVLHG